MAARMKRFSDFERRLPKKKRELYNTIPKLSYRDAIRMRGPIYDVLMKELCEDGCLKSAKYFKCFTDKENEMYFFGSVRERISKNRKLLYALVENIKMAELASRQPNQCHGLETTYKLLYDCMKLLEPFPQYEWLISDAYHVISIMCEKAVKLDVRINETAARIYYKYAQYLCRRAENIPKAIDVFEMALDMVRGQIWPMDENADTNFEYETMHIAVAKMLNSVFLKYGRLMAEISLEKATRLARKAVLIIAEVGVLKHKVLFCQAHFRHAEFLIEKFKYYEAEVILNKVIKVIEHRNDYESSVLACEFLYLKSICYMNSNREDLARLHLRQSFRLSVRYNLDRLEAEILMALGKIHSKYKNELFFARQAFLRAKIIYIKLKDSRNKKKAAYLYAKVKAQEIKPFFVDLLKSSEEKYCGFYHLRLWKGLGIPFWPQMFEAEQKDEIDPAHCLVDDGVDLVTLKRRKRLRDRWRRVTKQAIINRQLLQHVRHDSLVNEVHEVHKVHEENEIE